MDKRVVYSDEALIDMVRHRENLFDKARPDYKDEEIKAAAWTDIANTFNMRTEDCQTRWVRLRERFGRELRLHKRGVPLSKEWHLFSRMRWLERFIQPRNRMSNAKARAMVLQARGLVMDAVDGGGSGTNSGSHEDLETGSPSTAGPLWPHTLKLWAGEPPEQEEQDSLTSQDMAIDMAAHVSAEVSQPSSPAEHHNYADDRPGAYPYHDMTHSGPFEESVKESLSAMAGSLDSIREHVEQVSLLAQDRHAEDPDQLFARSLAASLRALPRAKRTQAKMRLLAVLAEYEDP